MGYRFALSPSDAEAYLKRTLLRERYLTIMKEAEAQLRKGVIARMLMGSEVDEKKLQSSAKFFGEVSNGHDSEVHAVCMRVLELSNPSSLDASTKTSEAKANSGANNDRKKTPRFPCFTFMGRFMG